MITIDANDFSLSLEFEKFETDAIIKMRVESSSFAGCGKLDVSKSIIETFAGDLESLCRTLSGRAILCETYGEGYVELVGNGKGQIDVRGLVVGHSENGYMSEQRLSFENVIDQTFLPKLIQAISAVL
ncbi:MAG: hypothetical protein E7628_02715 [Ruminococcaceae bacterium]|nr:hypothetical protein [Oscillospiraceae bacterium]